jgi:hypothetical protein
VRGSPYGRHVARVLPKGSPPFGATPNRRQPPNEGSCHAGPLPRVSGPGLHGRTRPRHCTAYQRSRGTFFSFFFFLPFSFFFLRPLLWGLCLQHPHFLKLAPILGSVESSIPHRDWKFHFFPNFIFAKLRVHIDLHIPCWDFRFMKK